MNVRPSTWICLLLAAWVTGPTWAAGSLTADLPDGQGEIKLRFDKGELEAGRAEVNGNVSGTLRFWSKGGKTRAPVKVEADHILAVLKRSQGAKRAELESFLADGSVEVTAGDIRGTCRNVSLTMLDQTLTLSGSDGSKVHAERGGLSFDGPRFTLKLNERTLRGQGPITAKLKLRNQEAPGKLTADGGVDVRAPDADVPGLCILRGPVRYEDGDVLIQTEALEAHLKTPKVKGAKKSLGNLEVTRLLAPLSGATSRHAVTITVAEHSMHCKSASYDVAARFLQLADGVRVSVAQKNKNGSTTATLTAEAVYAQRDSDGAWSLRSKTGAFDVTVTRGPGGPNR